MTARKAVSWRCWVLLRFIYHIAFDIVGTDIVDLYTLILLLYFGPRKPPSSLSSPFCGHKICFKMIARIIIPTTKNQTHIRIGVMTQPMICITWELKTLPIAKVDVMSAVLGKTYEYQVIWNSILPRPTQDQWAPTDMKKNQKARPHIQRLIQEATTLRIIAATVESPIKSLGSARWAPSAMPMTPATVNPLGPTDTNMPGLVLSCGSFWVIRRYMKAEYIIIETMKPIPWRVNPPTMMSNAFLCTTVWLRTPACGPMMRSGYAGNIQIGVICAIVKDAVDHLLPINVCCLQEGVISYMTKYTPIELSRAKAASIQKHTVTASFSQ